jgi:hypothetical protein
MKRAAVLFCLFIILAHVVATPAVAAEPFPAQPAQGKTAMQSGPPPNVYPGYVPPAPIRHTWPGGYRVLFHEVINTLIEHMLGQY